MNSQQLAQANIDNLHQLWQHMGAAACTLPGMQGFGQSTGWPHRCWPVTGKVDKTTALVNSLKYLEGNYIMPLCSGEHRLLQHILLENNYHVSSEQTAMFLDLQQTQLAREPAFVISPVHSHRAIHEWTHTASHAFGYLIDNKVMQGLVTLEGVCLYIVRIDNVPAATVMLYQRGEVTGIHQLGVIKEFRGRGLARKIMTDLTWLCANMDTRYLVLQASRAAERLYLSLGFTAQFMLKNYQRNANSMRANQRVRVI
jgi:GNAT superfamily N-acetyltransferase